MRVILVAAIVATALACVSSSSAKDFGPGDLRLCNARHCAVIRDPAVLRRLARFYYGSSSPPLARAPRLGAPAYELRFRNGYATGIVASTSLDRFLSYGVNLGHFRARRWYRVPARVAAELRTLARPLAPLHVTRAALHKSF